MQRIIDSPPAAARYGTSGVAHYTSTSRRDAVKREWEEPVTLAILRQALNWVSAWAHHPAILDIGCGLGDGLQHFAQLRPDHRFAYRGLDVDVDMVHAARVEHSDIAEARFDLGDVRDHDWSDAADIVYSCGVPWSHLTPEELGESVRCLATSARQQRRRVALVLDVLGRYSAEWPDRWDSSRWNYVMSFFNGDGEPPTATMSTWSGTDLEATVRSKCEAAGCHVGPLVRWDRAVSVGRHADSGQHPSLNAGLRGAVNHLAAGQPVTPKQLRIARHRNDLSGPVARAWDRHVTGWNALASMAEDFTANDPAVPDELLTAGLVRAWAAEREFDALNSESVDETAQSARHARRLFEHLRAHEWRSQRGAGIGHTLLLACVIDGRRG
jgi:SAM-dependent methyltransferase